MSGSPEFFRNAVDVRYLSLELQKFLNSRRYVRRIMRLRFCWRLRDSLVLRLLPRRLLLLMLLSVLTNLRLWLLVLRCLALLPVSSLVSLSSGQSVVSDDNGNDLVISERSDKIYNLFEYLPPFLWNVIDVRYLRLEFQDILNPGRNVWRILRLRFNGWLVSSLLLTTMISLTFASW